MKTIYSDIVRKEEKRTFRGRRGGVLSFVTTHKLSFIRRQK